MTAPTLAEIVDHVARDYRDGAQLAPAGSPDWDDLPAFEQHLIRESVLPIVTATLAALEPLVTEWEADAKEYDQRADEAFSDGGRDIAANVYRANASTNARHALQLRDVIGGIKQ